MEGPLAVTLEKVQVPQKVANSSVFSSPSKTRETFGCLGQGSVEMSADTRKPEPLASLKELVEEAQPKVENALEVAT